MTKQLLWTKKT